MASQTHHCQECGTPYARAKADQRFCSTTCCKTFNNRRMRRGAYLYDLFMAARYQRATHAGNITTMAQLAALWREEDDAARAGRPSWSADPDRDPLTEVSDQVDRVVRSARVAQIVA